MLALILVCALATAALLLAERRAAAVGRALAKLVAASAYLGVALVAGATGSTYGRLLLVALALSWLGDLLLLGSGRGALFAGGLGAFLGAHLLFAAAFATRGLDPPTLVVAMAVLGGPAWVVWHWLDPHLPPRLRVPVLGYLGAISLMLATAIGSAAAAPDPRLPAGAMLFWLSDLAVARDRFVAPGFGNRLWGLPLYFAAQLLLAATAGF